MWFIILNSLWSGDELWQEVPGNTIFINNLRTIHKADVSSLKHEDLSIPKEGTETTILAPA